MESIGECLRSQRRPAVGVACDKSNTGRMIAPSCPTRDASCLAASGVVGCGRLQPTSLRRGLFFERNRQSVGPLCTAAAEPMVWLGASPCSQTRLHERNTLTVTNEKSRSVNRLPRSRHLPVASSGGANPVRNSIRNSGRKADGAYRCQVGRVTLRRTQDLIGGQSRASWNQIAALAQSCRGPSPVCVPKPENKDARRRACSGRQDAWRDRPSDR